MSLAVHCGCSAVHSWSIPATSFFASVSAFRLPRKAGANVMTVQTRLLQSLPSSASQCPIIHSRLTFYSVSSLPQISKPLLSSHHLCPHPSLSTGSHCFLPQEAACTLAPLVFTLTVLWSIVPSSCCFASPPVPPLPAPPVILLHQSPLLGAFQSLLPYDSSLNIDQGPITQRKLSMQPSW